MIAVLKYNAGNVFSVLNALRRIGVEPVLTDDAQTLRNADRVLFPGQGEASNAMRYLREHNLDEVLLSLRKPVLGICIGQQLMCSHSEEGDTDCLGIFPMEVKRFQPKTLADKVPQMGWNSISFAGLNGSIGLFAGVEEGSFIYNVHSYYVPLSDEYTIAKCDYILPYSAALNRDNFFATQFHPEKSGSVGEKILRNFLEI